MQPLECCRLPHHGKNELDITALKQPLFFPCSCERIQVTLNLDGIVQVLDYHLSDTSIGMMTRIAVLKWLYHLYIKTPRKVGGDSAFSCVCQLPACSIALIAVQIVVVLCKL